MRQHFWEHLWPGQPLELRHEAGGRRWHLDGKPISTGTTLELFTPYGWVRGGLESPHLDSPRFYWGRSHYRDEIEGDDYGPSHPFHDLYWHIDVETMRFRWPRWDDVEPPQYFAQHLEQIERRWRKELELLRAQENEEGG